MPQTEQDMLSEDYVSQRPTPMAATYTNDQPISQSKSDEMKKRATPYIRQDKKVRTQSQQKAII